MAWTLFPLVEDSCVCADCRCRFYTIRFRRKFSAVLFLILWQWTRDFFSIRYGFFSPLPLFLLSAFLTGAPLNTNHIYCWFCTFRWTKIYRRQLFLHYDPFWENVVSKLEAHIEETIGSILFESIQSFSPLILHFVYCFDNCLLLPLVDFFYLDGS